MPKERFVVDEKSVAMNVINGCEYLSGILHGEDEDRDHEKQARRLGMTLDEYVREYRRSYGKTADETYSIEAGIYAECNLRFWMKYQMTYVIKKSTTATYTRENITEKPDVRKLDMPFPAIMVVLDLDDVRDEGHSIAYIICKREKEKFDVTAIVDGIVYYCPVGEKTIDNLFSNKITEYGMDAFQRYYLNLAWHTILFLAAYNRNRKIVLARRIKLRGKNGVKAEPSDYVFEDVVHETIAYTTVEKEDMLKPGSALSIDGLIPPDERPEEIVMQNVVHDSPKRHLVSGHYRTYWTGKGKKIPIRRFVASFERGGKPGDKTSPRTKIYK